MFYMYSLYNRSVIVSCYLFNFVKLIVFRKIVYDIIGIIILLEFAVIYEQKTCCKKDWFGRL